MKHYIKKLQVPSAESSGMGVVDKYMNNIAKKFSYGNGKQLKSQLTLENLYSTIDGMIKDEYKPQPYIYHPDTYRALSAHFIFDTENNTIYQNIPTY